MVKKCYQARKSVIKYLLGLGKIRGAKDRWQIS
jgi:hypothetical protein